MQVAPRVTANEAAVPQKAAEDVGNLAKGFAWALMIEGAAALAIYAVWHFWHVLQFHF